MEYKRDEKIIHDQAFLLDFSDLTANRFRAINQFTIEGSGTDRSQAKCLVSLNTSSPCVRALPENQGKARSADKGGSLFKGRNTGLIFWQSSRRAPLWSCSAVLHSFELATASPAVVRLAEQDHSDADIRRTFVKGH